MSRLILAALCGLGLCAAANGAQPSHTFTVTGNPAGVVKETHGSVTFLCGVWFAKNGSYVKLCYPAPAKKQAAAPKA